ncbi:MAG: PAS domain-containing sensor histidine kinase [Gemmatimonadaceae bacterium]
MHQPTDRLPGNGASESDEAPEDRERAAARRRGEELEVERAATGALTRSPSTGLARASVAARAFGALAENVRDYAIFLMDPNGVITFWGEGARLIKWWTKDQAEGAHVRLLYPAGGSEDGTAEENLEIAAEEGEYSGEGPRVRSDGSTFWAGVTITALWDEDGTLLGFAKVTRDLTASRAAEALLAAAATAADVARAEAVAATAAKTGFMATMSHEIRTPINAMMGYMGLLSEEIDGPITPGQRRHMDSAVASAKHLLDLVDEVLDFSRIEANRMPVNRAVVRVGDAVARAIELVAPQARARGLALTNAVSGFSAGLAAWADDARVRQILVNLLGNAVKFTDARDEEDRSVGRITVSAGMATQASPDAVLVGTGPWMYIRVEDTGIGIPADRIEASFEPFTQGDMALTRERGGTGLGLAISRRLARVMGGDVTAKSEDGLGSTFFLWLPAAPVESLETADHEGRATSQATFHAPLRDGSTGASGGVSVAASTPASGSAGPLRALGEAVLGNLERVLYAFVARLRSDPGTPSAHTEDETRLEDHLASFLADLASTLITLDGSLTEQNADVRDSSAIQRVVSERHGAQRARLGWSDAEIRREFTILREELTAAVLRRPPAPVDGPDLDTRRAEAGRALDVLARFLAVGERLSLAAYRNAAAGRHLPTEDGAVP